MSGGTFFFLLLVHFFERSYEDSPARVLQLLIAAEYEGLWKVDSFLSQPAAGLRAEILGSVTLKSSPPDTR